MYYLQRALQLKYPAHVNSLTVSRSEEMVYSYARVSTNYLDELRQWRDTQYYNSLVKKIQLPFTQAPKPPPVDPEVIKARRQELARRLVEINAKKRDERLVEDEANVKVMLTAKDFYQQGYEMKYNRALAKMKIVVLPMLAYTTDDGDNTEPNN